MNVKQQAALKWVKRALDASKSLRDFMESKDGRKFFRWLRGDRSEKKEI